MQKWGALALCCAWLISGVQALPQTTGSGGTVEVTVTDPTGAAVPNASVDISNRVTGYQKSSKTDNTGVVRLLGVPPQRYHIAVNAAGFQTAQQDVEIRTSLPIALKFPLQLATETTSVEVHSDVADLIESVPTPHTDIDRDLFSKLPRSGVGQGISDVLTLAAPGVVADSNGFFHPQGDHAETQFSVDNQPISDQQSKQFSNQLPLNAIQSFEAISGGTPPEFGDKASLVVNAITRSGLGTVKPFGNFSVDYGSFGTVGETLSYGFGNGKAGNFLVVNTSRTGRYLDTPEFRPLHAIGNNEQIFDRADYQLSEFDTLHLNLFLARSWFQTPNTVEQQATGQDQREQVRSFNIAPGWVHLFGASTALNVNPFFRQDHVQYFPSGDRLSDLPATVSQYRRLRNYGLKTDVSYTKGIHNAKAGIQVMRTGLAEDFNLGITEPAFNNPADPAFQSGLLPFDLTRGGRLLSFRGRTIIKQYAAFVQDSISFAGITVLAGLRGDLYRGLSRASGLQPRFGVSYLYKPTSTVLRASYSRFFETPYNENLILSSSTGIGGLAANSLGAFGSSVLQPGRRNQYDAGIQQGMGKHVVVDASYFWKYTKNAFDFDTLFNTPIAFPIEWRKSKLDGVSVRINLARVGGFSAFTVLGHTRARFFGPEVGGLIFNSPVDVSVFRIDHDQSFQQTTSLRYQYKKDGPWAAFTWRYDSGLVSGRVPDIDAALALTPGQQAAIGVFCGNVVATIANPITSCTDQRFGVKLLRIPPPGKENPDTHPTRVRSRHLFDAGIGTDNLLHGDRYKITLQLTAVNLSNEVALYNFLSTFSGTHFVTPRSYRVEMGVVF